MKISARDTIPETIARVPIAIVTNGSVQLMQFVVGKQLSAAFKASSAILAVE